MSQGEVFRSRLPSKVLTIDTSQTGWGAHLDGMTVLVRWMDVFTTLPHINYLELLAVLLALWSFVSVLQGRSIAIMSDNNTAVSYINHQ